MAYVVTTFIGGASKQRIQMGAEELVRAHGFGNRWSKLRFSVHLSILCRAPIPGSNIVFGLCQSHIGWSQPNCVDAIGMWFGNQQTSPYSALVSQSTTSFLYAAGGAAFRKVGSNFTATATGGGGVQAFFAEYPNIVRNVIVYDFFKNTAANTMAITCWVPQSNGAAVLDISRFSMLDNIQNPDSPNFGTNYGQITTSTVSMGTSTQTWDSIFFSWNKSVPVIEVGEIVGIQIY